MSCYFDDDDEYGGNIIRHIYKAGHSVNVIRKENGDVVSSNGHLIGNINDDDIDDLIDEFEEGWKEVTWVTPIGQLCLIAP